MVVGIKAKLLISGGVIAAVAAIWHVLCIFGGPSWFAFARAPQQIITSAEQGTLLAPVGTLIVAGLMFACTLFAFSATGLIRKLPLLTPALVTIALLCTVRGLIAVPFFLTPAGADLWQIIASSVWLYVGICFIAGALLQFSAGKKHLQS
ncbi:hypothetical protein SG34_005125 [Thalassomonas viridans]|uniref:Uncharacterized protein n=1 Tax=Thalassomonas viridans TaxID=137584 RepID=A0AAE9Z594_9GAMM|nr:hypothetical protein [Thalassomonas viridans]WDE06309.1 hypothetical protein SG34_005125 [Thalassomonas viridans]